MQIKYLKLSENAAIPARATPGSAGYDLCACIESPITLRPGEAEMIPLGFATEIPAGYAGFVFSRSGLGGKKSVVVAQGVGIIDSDYRGQWMVPLRNLGSGDYTVVPGERIAQVVFMPVCPGEFWEAGSFEELSGTTRGQGGFGSTGKG